MNDILVNVKELNKQFKKSHVLKNVSFSVKEGMICGLVGPNGAGKTTIMKALGGLILPTSGSIELFGETSEKGLAHSRSRMSFMIEIPYAKQSMSARENLEKLRLQKGLPDRSRIDEVLERLGIAGALLTKPELMVLDEPINGLDPEGIVEIREMLLKLNREEHITIIISSHILSELSLLCSDYLFIRHGELIESLSAAELSRQCHEYYHIRTDNDSLVPAVLKNELGIEDIEVEKDGSVRVYERIDEQRLISRTLFENNITPVELHMKDADLEQYYMNMVGEENVQSDKGTAVQDAS